MIDVHGAAASIALEASVTKSSSRRMQDRPLRRPADHAARPTLPVMVALAEPNILRRAATGLGHRPRRRHPRGHAAPGRVRLAAARAARPAAPQPAGALPHLRRERRCCFRLGYAAGEAANRRGDARVLLLSLAFMATGGFMGLHAFGHAGVLFSESRAGFQIAIGRTTGERLLRRGLGLRGRAARPRAVGDAHRGRLAPPS